MTPCQISGARHSPENVFADDDRFSSLRPRWYAARMSTAKYEPLGSSSSVRLDGNESPATNGIAEVRLKLGPAAQLPTRRRRAGYKTFAVGLFLAATALVGLLHSRRGRPRSALPSRQLEGFDTGRWASPIKAWDIAEVKRVWGAGPMAVVTSDPRRPVAASSFSWMPSNGAELRPWDPVEFVLRCINSRAGMLMVGGEPAFELRPPAKLKLTAVSYIDSISHQQMEALEGMMRIKSEHNISPSFSYRDVDGHRGWVLSNGTFKNFVANRLPHIPPSRLEQPFFRFFKHFALVSNDELRQISREKVGKEVEPSGSLLQPSWERYLPKDGDKLGWGEEQPSILVLNTGPHWSEHEFFKIDHAQLVQLNQAVATAVLERVLSVPRLTTMYRSIAPSHAHCDDATAPIYPASPFAAHPEYSSWNWQMFGIFSDAWASVIDRLAPDGLGGGVGSERGRVIYLNVTDMSGQRPDAHKGGNDCLHVSRAGSGVVQIKRADAALCSGRCLAYLPIGTDSCGMLSGRASQFLSLIAARICCNQYSSIDIPFSIGEVRTGRIMFSSPPRYVSVTDQDSMCLPSDRHRRTESESLEALTWQRTRTLFAALSPIWRQIWILQVSWHAK